jgi:hypothetical protein
MGRFRFLQRRPVDESGTRVIVHAGFQTVNAECTGSVAATDNTAAVVDRETLMMISKWACERMEISEDVIRTTVPEIRRWQSSNQMDRESNQCSFGIKQNKANIYISMKKCILYSQIKQKDWLRTDYVALFSMEVGSYVVLVFCLWLDRCFSSITLDKTPPAITACAFACEWQRVFRRKESIGTEFSGRFLAFITYWTLNKFPKKLKYNDQEETWLSFPTAVWRINVLFDQASVRRPDGATSHWLKARLPNTFLKMTSFRLKQLPRYHYGKIILATKG